MCVLAHPDDESLGTGGALAKGYTLFGTYTWAGPLFWYSHRDLGATTDTRENFFGLLRNDFSPKPSYSAYRTAVVGG